MKTIYVKYTDYRKSRFRIMTSIVEDGNRKVVVKKSAPGGSAEAHLRGIAETVPLLERFCCGRVSVCPCRYEDGRLVFPYIRGTSLLENMRRSVRTDGLDGFLPLLHEYVAILLGPEDNLIPFAYTDAFGEVFGEIGGLSDVPALAVSNLDASPANIIETENTLPTLIDYEWICNFPVPRDFVLFRHLRFLYSEPGFDWGKSITLGSLLQECGVKMELAKLYELYDAFQRFVCVEEGAAISCAEVFERHRKLIYDGGEGLFRKPKHFVFLDTGSGFNEQEKLVFPSVDGNVDLTIDVENVYNVRFDPFEGQRTLTNGMTFRTDTGETLAYDVPERMELGDRIVWGVPANAHVQIPADAKKLYIRGFILFMGERDEYWLEETSAAERRVGEAQASLREAQEEVRDRVQALEESKRVMEQEYMERLGRKDGEIAQLRQEYADEMAEVTHGHERELEQMRQKIASLEQTVQAMRSSTSWKMTGWVRKLGALRNGRQRRD